MFTYIGNRRELMGHIPKTSIREIVEVGVCKGENAGWLLANLEPDILNLVDQWVPFTPIDPPSYFSSDEDRQFLEKYFGGPIDQQTTFDALYQVTCDKFSDDSRVKILRNSSRNAAATFDDNSLDIIYIDADHNYNAVLDDLFIWQGKLKDSGYIILNDHTINASGTPEYGVVQAVSTFLRNHTQYSPLAMTLSNYADLIIGKRSFDHTELLKNIISSGKAFEVPDSIASNFHLRKAGGLNWLSFC